MGFWFVLGALNIILKHITISASDRIVVIGIIGHEIKFKNDDIKTEAVIITGRHYITIFGYFEKLILFKILRMGCFFFSSVIHSLSFTLNTSRECHISFGWQLSAYMAIIQLFFFGNSTFCKPTTIYDNKLLLSCLEWNDEIDNSFFYNMNKNIFIYELMTTNQFYPKCSTQFSL